MAASSPHLLLPVLVTALVGWRLYARTRRLVGRQRFRPVRSWLAAGLFPLLVLLLLLPASASTSATVALLGGVALGCGLGAYGLKTTTYESTADGLFYTPSAHLGIGLSLMLALRLAYRLVQARAVGYAEIEQRAPTGSPLTLAIFGVLAGYYAVYAIGLLRWQRRVRGAGPRG